MSKKNVLFLVESMRIGGAEKALLSLLKSIDKTQYTITVKVISFSGELIADLLSIPDITVKGVVKPSQNPFKRIINALIIKALYKLLPAEAVGNFLCHGYDTAIAFCEGYLTKWVAASTLPLKKIAWVHTDMVSNDWPLNTGLFKSVNDEKKAYHAFNQVITVTDAIKHGMQQKFDLTNIITIYNKVDPDIHAKAAEKVQLPPLTGLKIVSVGRLEHVKGYDILVNAMDILVNKRHIDASLIIVGGGSQYAPLQQQIQQLGLGANIQLIGSQPNPYPYIAAADIYVCPSRAEGFNIALLEALTLHKPVIATATAGPTEILASTPNARLVPISATEIANALTHTKKAPEPQQ